MLLDAHHHLWYDLDEGGKTRHYFPARQRWHICMRWAYTGLPPYNKDPKSLYERQLLRMSDYEGKYTIAGMDHWKINAATLFPVDYDYNFGQAAEISWEEKHQHASQLGAKYKGRILPYVQIDPRRTNSLELVKRAFEEYKNFFALKLVPGAGFYPWDPMCYPLYEYCLNNDIPVAICVEGLNTSYRKGRFCDPIHVGDMHTEFPDLKVIMLHTGFMFTHWFEQCICAAVDVNTWAEMDTWFTGAGFGQGAGMKSLRPNMYTNEEGLIRMLAFAKSTCGAHKIMWGTDSSHGPSYAAPKDGVDHQGWTAPAKWIQSLPERGAKYGYDFTKEDADLIVGGTAAHVLKIKEDPSRKVPEKYGWKYRYPSPNWSGR
ncbi:MAG: amidohydrolase family protein [Chloroflexi bacterium]|nr:amidohydrolase family protein [Chloroflexota bacterium]